MTERRWFLVAIAAVLTGFVIWRSQNGKNDAVVYPNEKVNVGGAQRVFRLVVPHELKDGSVPVVFAFHGVGDTPDAMPKYADLDRLACKHGFVLVYPIASGRMWRTEGAASSKASNSDIEFFDALLQHVKQREWIDDERIYLMGMSNGASFAQLLAHERSERIAAVVAHSGTLPKEWQSAKPKRHFPILLVVGTNDAVDAMRETTQIYKEKGHASKLLTIPRLGHTWAKDHNEEFWEFLADKRLSGFP